MGGRVKIKLRNIFKTINFIYLENLGLLGLFLNKIEKHEKMPPYPNEDNCIFKMIFFEPSSQNMV